MERPDSRSLASTSIDGWVLGHGPREFRSSFQLCKLSPAMPSAPGCVDPSPLSCIYNMFHDSNIGENAQPYMLGKRTSVGLNHDPPTRFPQQQVPLPAVRSRHSCQQHRTCNCTGCNHAACHLIGCNAGHNRWQRTTHHGQREKSSIETSFADYFSVDRSLQQTCRIATIQRTNS